MGDLRDPGLGRPGTGHRVHPPPVRGLQRLQEAASHGGQLRLAMKVAAAELCAYSLQDRALFNRLLDEVDAATQVGSTFDLLAKQRAKTLRTEADDLFPDQS